MEKNIASAFLFCVSDMMCICRLKSARWSWMSCAACSVSSLFFGRKIPSSTYKEELMLNVSLLLQYLRRGNGHVNCGDF